MQGDILLKYWFLHSVFTYHFYITVGFRAFNLIVEVKVLVAQPCPTLQFTATLWTIAHQTPLSMEFSRQECWSGFPFPSPEDLPNPGMKPGSLDYGLLYCLNHWDAHKIFFSMVYIVVDRKFMFSLFLKNVLFVESISAFCKVRFSQLLFLLYIPMLHFMGKAIRLNNEWIQWLANCEWGYGCRFI